MWILSIQDAFSVFRFQALLILSFSAYSMKFSLEAHAKSCMKYLSMSMQQNYSSCSELHPMHSICGN